MVRLLLSFFLISFVACLSKTNSSSVDATATPKVEKKKNAEIEIHTDSNVILFGDSSYKLTLHIFDTANNFNEEKNNSVLTFSKQDSNQIKILFSDSMFCMYPEIDLEDFNNDKIKDVLVFNYTGARANPTYHLYLTDLKNRKLIRVKGFEELPNPDLDTFNNIITSFAQSGSNYYSFYRINTKNKLINLGHGYEDNPNDSNQYERVVRQILKENN